MSGRGEESMAMDSPMNTGMSGGGSGWTPGGQGSIRSAKEIKLEIYGIVYLFYPVNIDRLALNKVDGETEVSETVEAADGGAPATDSPTEPAASASPPTADSTASPANGDAPAATDQPEGAQPTAQ